MLNVFKIVVLSWITLIALAHDEYEWCILNSMINLRYFNTCADFSNYSSTFIYFEGMKGEYENTQLLFEYKKKFVKSLSFKVSNFSNGLPSSIITLYRIGNVNCANTTYPSSGGGWRPDPIFELNENSYGEYITVTHEYTQSIWISVYIPYNTAPMIYHSNITVSISGLESHHQFIIPITLNVWNITIPTTLNATFQNVFAFDESALPRLYDPYIYNLTEIKYRYFDLLSAFRVPPDALYTNPRSVDDYQYLVTKTAWSNIADVANFSFEGTYNCTVTPQYVQEVINTVNATLIELEANGMDIKSFYVYGFDEVRSYCLPAMYAIYNELTSIWPNLRTMSCIDWGFMPPLNLDLSAWSVVYYMYDETRANQWVRAGKEQWLYHSDDPRDDESMNTFIEKPLMMSRILFWFGAKAQAQGWLYWAINKWDGCPSQGIPNKSIIEPDTNNLTFINFDPATYDYCGSGNIKEFVNGDGFYIYPGEYGPVPSIRLQNVRDGFEDIELLRMLENKSEINKYVDQIVIGTKNYTLDPILLQNVRRQIANNVLDNVFAA